MSLSIRCRWPGCATTLLIDPRESRHALPSEGAFDREGWRRSRYGLVCGAHPPDPAPEPGPPVEGRGLPHGPTRGGGS